MLNLTPLQILVADILYKEFRPDQLVEMATWSSVEWTEIMSALLDETEETE